MTVTGAEVAELGTMAADYAAADEAGRAAILAELRRRDRADRDRAAREAERAEWESMALAQYAAAEAQCNGYLVRHDSRVRHEFSEAAPRQRKPDPDSDDAAEIKARRRLCGTCGHPLRHPWHEGISPFILWEGTEEWARKYASEELCAFWDGSPRITVTQYRQQISDGRRVQRDDMDREADSTDEAGETTMTTAPEEAPDHVARIRQDIAGRAAQIRQEIRGTAPRAPAAVAVRAPAALVRQREAVDGTKTLGYIFTFLRRFALWGSDAEIVTAALWIAHTYARDGDGMPIWAYLARLGILGPSGSGKSWKARLIGKLSYKGKILVEPTKPSFIDFCADHNTVILTEADEAFRSPGRSRGILAVVNASYEPDRSTSRKQGGVAVDIPLFTHMVLDGIDDVLLSENRPDLRAMMSRCVILRARRGPEGYRPPRFDKQARGIAEMIGQRSAQWMEQEVQDGIADVVPEVPEHLGNRPFALWEPLFTVALRADNGDPEGPWSLAVRDACEQLETGNGLAEADEDAESELDRVMAGWED